MLDALKQSGEETLSEEEIDNGIKSLESIALEINRLGTYAYRDSLQVFQQLVTNHAELAVPLAAMDEAEHCYCALASDVAAE